MAEIKPICGVDDRVKLADAIPLKTPFTLNIFPTNACNFRCSYCAQSLGGQGLKEQYDFGPATLTIQMLKTAVEQAQAFPNKFKLVSMMGHGEPLLNPHLPEMIALVKQAGIAERVDLITNASLLTKQKSLALIEAGLDVIRISLQGLSAEKYQEISQAKINFAEFLENIAFFYQNRKNCKVFVKIPDVALAEGEEALFYQTFENIVDRMYIERIEPVYDGVCYAQEVTKVKTDRYGNVHEKRYVCPQPFYMLSLWPNGDVAPCDGIYKANPLGNISETSLIEMWQSESLRKFRLLQLLKQREAHTACRRCCAPDDVSHPADVLDQDAETLVRILSK